MNLIPLITPANLSDGADGKEGPEQLRIVRKKERRSGA